VPFSLPGPAELEKLIGELGIDEDSYVVVVPAGVHATDFGAAARVYWTFKVAGLGQVSILYGGPGGRDARPSRAAGSRRRNPAAEDFHRQDQSGDHRRNARRGAGCARWRCDTRRRPPA